jgi:GWxTD domain-containing protein
VTVPSFRSLPLLLAALAVAPLVAFTDDFVDTKRFPKLVRLLLTPEEQSLLSELKSDDERRQFQLFFWARRDPTPGTAANELEANVRAAWARADQLFAYPNQKGSETGCGQVLALLGKPEEVLGLETKVRFDDMQYLREGDRRAETWVYRDRPGLPWSFTRAELRVAFDSDCRFAEGGIVADDLKRAAASLVARPDVAYARGKDGRLLSFSAQTSGAAGAIDLLSAASQDFALAAETHLVLRGRKGEAIVAGLARVPAPLPARVSLAVRAADAEGHPLGTSVRDSTLAPLPDGSGVASWSLPLKPGHFRLTVAARVNETGKGAVATLDVDVPDFAGEALAASPIVAYADEPAGALPADPLDPWAAMQLGARSVRPRFGNVFTPADGLMLVATLHGARLDAATGKASLNARYSVLKDGKPVARGAPDIFTTADAVASVGPIPLASYAPGAYVARLEVTDAVAQQTLRLDKPFEIRAGEAK